MSYNYASDLWETRDRASELWSRSDTANVILGHLLDFNGFYYHNNSWGNTDHFTTGTSGGSLQTNADGKELLQINSGSTGGNYARLYKYIDRYRNNADVASWDKSKRLRVSAIPTGTSGQAGWIMIGPPMTNATVSTTEHVGFKVVDTTLYGTTANGTNESEVNLGTVSANQQVELYVVYATGERATFYVDGENKGEITTNLPSGNTRANTLSLSLATSDVTETSLKIGEIMVLQEE